eukprot:gene26195-24038_t
MTTTVTSSMHGKFSCFKHEGTQHIRSIGDCTAQLEVLNKLIPTCDSSITHNAVLQCKEVEGEDVLRIYDGGKGEPCEKVALAVNTMAERAGFADALLSDAGTAFCTIDGYLGASLTACSGTVTAINSAIEGYLAGDFLESITCVTIGSESYLKVDTGASPNNCVNHKHELNQMIEACD